MREVDITFRSERADRRNEAMDEPADRPGYRPSRPAALGIILASWDDEYGGPRARGGYRTALVAIGVFYPIIGVPSSLRVYGL